MSASHNPPTTPPPTKIQVLLSDIKVLLENIFRTLDGFTWRQLHEKDRLDEVNRGNVYRKALQRPLVMCPAPPPTRDGAAQAWLPSSPADDISIIHFPCDAARQNTNARYKGVK